jgi:predicted AlkP superfamily phosphohydrolase/phosphomutase
MNKWLLDNGYLVLKSSAESMKRKLWFAKKWNGLLRRTGILRILTARGRKLGHGQEQALTDMIDWSKTRA